MKDAEEHKISHMYTKKHVKKKTNDQDNTNYHEQLHPESKPYKKKTLLSESTMSHLSGSIELLAEEFLYVIVRNHLFIKNVSTSLRALYHFDNFGVRAAIVFAGLKGCNYFLCHGLQII